MLALRLIALLLSPVLTTSLDPWGNLLPSEVVPPSHIHDPSFKYQEWYLGPGPSGANVVAAWARGYTGKGVTVVFNDDGLDYRHPEFKEKYNKLGQ